MAHNLDCNCRRCNGGGKVYSAWTPGGNQPPDVGIVNDTDHVVSFKTGGSTGDHTLIADGDYSDDPKGFKEAHNHYGSRQEGPGYFDEDRGHYTGPDS